MTKIIQSPYFAHSPCMKKITYLECQVQGLTTELDEYRTRFGPFGTKHSDRTGRDNATTRQPEQETKHYQRATKASTNRTKAPEKIESVQSSAKLTTCDIGCNGHQYRYAGGRLAYITAKRHYQFSTESSRRKTEWATHIYNPRRSKSPETDGLADPSSETDEPPENIMSEGHEDADHDANYKLQAICPSPYSAIRGLLGAREKCVVIPSRRGYDFLSRALRLSQQIVYYGLRTHLPDLCASIYPQGSHEIRFGFTELESTFVFRSRDLSFGVNNKYRVYDAMYRITDLRNLVCHFGTSTGRLRAHSYDSELREVEYLARVFGDNGRVRKIVRLRTRLRDAAQEVLRKIEDLALWSVLPFAQPWAEHEKFTLGKILHHASNYSDLAFMSAIDWATKDPERHEYFGFGWSWDVLRRLADKWS
ncbi:hypothetical protein F5Y15DRAFT_415173 [Xylariaceae sp. FL0016]|nr:hypothetical protein F5Y15DRAFT_415173 [Xylariaceae sp. FL0016]